MPSTVHSRPDSSGPSTQNDSSRARTLDFSLFYFASDEGGQDAADKYRLILESARFADTHGFAAVWTPERHFHAFGGLSPNPVVTAAALSVATERIGLRSGSVVLPLHHPIRVAEEWALVDNLSGGRVGLGVASGWFPDDFVLDPDIYDRRGEVLYEKLETLRRLWRGETLSLRNGRRDIVDVRTIPRPVQPELPVWITAASNPETFRRAGSIGANVLTHLLGQSIEELAEKVQVYRDAWAVAGHEGRGIVSLMLHTFVGTCDDEVRETVREPMKRYLGSSVNLVRRYVDSLPIFKNAPDVDPDNLSEEDLDAILEYSFERYYRTSGLFGTATTCLQTIDRLKQIGVDDVACLVDFGVATETVLDSLEHLDALRRQATSEVRSSHDSSSSRPPERVNAHAEEGPGPDTLSVPGRANLERRVTEIWSEVLQVADIGLDQNFFELGGHSLLAVRVLHAIEKGLNRKLVVTDLFRFPTVRTLARYLSGDDHSSESTTARARATRRRRDRSSRRARRARE